jgi:SAM-dependent methyltransferase
LHTSRSLDINYQNEALVEMEINYFLCETCGGVSQGCIPSKETLETYYSTCPAHGKEVTPPVTLAFFRKRVRDLLLATRLGGGATVLEIGCASGEFSSLLIQSELVVFGIEPGETSAVEAARRGINIIGRKLDDLDDTSLAGFDLVFSMGTFEHLPEPRATFEAMIPFVKDGGYIYIDVPDNSIIADGGRNDWGPNLITPHLHHFSPQSLFLLLSFNSLVPIYFDRCLELPYSSLAIIGKKISASTYGESTFRGALRAEGSKFRGIAHRLKDYIERKNLIGKSVVFWGCGSDLHGLLTADNEICEDFMICDSSKYKVGKLFLGKRVLDPNEVTGACLVVVAVLDPRVSSIISAHAKLWFPEGEVISISDISTCPSLCQP